MLVNNVGYNVGYIIMLVKSWSIMLVIKLVNNVGYKVG